MSNQNTISQIFEIPLSDIVISDDNVRISHAEKDLDELAESIRIHGLLQPIVLKGSNGSPPYEVISGQRRFLSHERILKTKTIKAVFAGDLNRTEAVIRSLVENLQRADLEYSDTKIAVTELFKTLGSIDEVHKATGLSKRRIKDFLLIEARASDKMKSLIAEGKASPADVKRAIQAAQDNLNKAEQLLDLMLKYNPTSHEKRRLVSYGNSSPDSSADELFAEALKPHVEKKVVISLSEQVKAALTAATASYEMEASDLAEKILIEWLDEKGFK